MRSIITFKELTKSCDIGLSTVIINTKFLKNNKFYFQKLKQRRLCFMVKICQIKILEWYK